MPRYTGVVVFESLVQFHTTFSSRLASRFLRWKAHTCVFEGFARSWFVKESKITRRHNFELVKEQSRLDVRKYHQINIGTVILLNLI